MKIFGGKNIAGGTASRAEVYGLFIAAIVLVGGGVGGAFAYSANGGFNNSPRPTESNSVSPTSSTPAAKNSEEGSKETSSNSNTSKNSGNDSNSKSNSKPSSCSYSTQQLADFNALRANKTAQRNSIQGMIDGINAGIATNQAAIAEQQSLPYRPVDITEDITGNSFVPVYRVTLSTDNEIARIQDNINSMSSQIPQYQNQISVLNGEISLIPSC